MSRANAAPGQSASPSPAETVWQISLTPRWLLFSALPQALGCTRWAMTQAIIQFDHQTAALPTRRRGADHAQFVVPQRDIAAATGLNERTVGRISSALARTHLLSSYNPGGGRQAGAGGKWCAYTVNRDTILALAQYALPRIIPMHGGVRGLGPNQLPAQGLHVYGWRERNPLVLSTDKLFMIAHRGDDPGDPDPGEVARICGL